MKQIKFARTGYILVSILFYLSGIICITIPNINGKTTAIAGGLILIIYGIIKIVGYLSKDLYGCQKIWAVCLACDPGFFQRK